MKVSSLLSVLALSLASQVVQAADCATKPAARAVDYPWMSIARWQSMHADQMARADKGGIDVMFVGDSITEMWPRQLFDDSFGKYRAANFGIGGDHTGNVLYRLQDPHLAPLKPKAVVLLIGVNNLNLCGESAEQVFAGIKLIVAALRKQYPDARILLNGVFPEGKSASDEVRARIIALDKMIATLDDQPRVTFRNYGPLFLQPDGSISQETMGDYLHLTEKGYRIWAAAMLPDIARLVAPTPAAAQ
ncbi:MAG: GDSL-type esterase/lipase family protein [Massilia sp.]